MKSFKKNSTLFEMAPILIREWHPTANGDLTPRSVKIGYPKKVWWICSEGHEWQATIKCRLQRNDCPSCEKEASKKEIDFSLSLPGIGKNNRKIKRFKAKATVVIEVPDSGHWVYADMKDFSSQGFGFEIEAAIQPRTVIKLKFDKAIVSSSLDKSLKSSFNNSYQTYNSTVQWCKKIEDDQSMSSFGIGVKLL